MSEITPLNVGDRAKSAPISLRHSHQILVMKVGFYEGAPSGYSTINHEHLVDRVSPGHAHALREETYTTRWSPRSQRLLEAANRD